MPARRRDARGKQGSWGFIPDFPVLGMPVQSFTTNPQSVLMGFFNS